MQRDSELYFTITGMVKKQIKKQNPSKPDEEGQGGQSWNTYKYTKTQEALGIFSPRQFLCVTALPIPELTKTCLPLPLGCWD